MLRLPIRRLHIAGRGDLRQALCWDVLGAFGSRRGDNTDRRILQPCFYGRTHTGTECFVPLDLSGLTVRNVCLDFVEFVAHFAIRGLIVIGEGFLPVLMW
jgi:hypothetical protein